MAKQDEKNMDQRMADLEALAADLAAREENLKAREDAQNRSRTAANTPKSFQTPKDVKGVLDRARRYLVENYFVPGQREMRMLEALAFAFSKHKTREEIAEKKAS